MRPAKLQSRPLRFNILVPPASKFPNLPTPSAGRFAPTVRTWGDNTLTPCAVHALHHTEPRPAHGANNPASLIATAASIAAEARPARDVDKIGKPIRFSSNRRRSVSAESWRELGLYAHRQAARSAEEPRPAQGASDMSNQADLVASIAGEHRTARGTKELASPSDAAASIADEPWPSHGAARPVTTRYGCQHRRTLRPAHRDISSGSPLETAAIVAAEPRPAHGVTDP